MTKYSKLAIFTCSLLMVIFCSAGAFAEGEQTQEPAEEQSEEQTKTSDEASEETPPPVEKKVKRKKKSRSPWRFETALAYDSGGPIIFKDVKVTSTIAGNYSTSASYRAESAPSLSVSLLYTRPRSWGFLSTVVYQMSRKITSVKVGDTTTDVDASFSTIDIEGNALYRWQGFSLYFGGNYTIPSYKETSDSSAPSPFGAATTTISGSIGVQTGCSYFFTRNIQGTVYYKMLGVKAKTTYANSDSIDYGTGYFANIGLKIGYVF